MKRIQIILLLLPAIAFVITNMGTIANHFIIICYCPHVCNNKSNSR